MGPTKSQLCKIDGNIFKKSSQEPAVSQNFSKCLEPAVFLPVVQLYVRFPELVIAEVDLLEAVEFVRVPLEVVVGPGHPHPGVDRQDGATLVDVEVDDGHAELHHHRLKWKKCFLGFFPNSRIYIRYLLKDGVARIIFDSTFPFHLMPRRE